MPNSTFSEHIGHLSGHHDRLQRLSVSQLFQDDSSRFSTFSRNLNGLLFDFSKNRLDKAALDALIEMAQDLKLESKRDAMFAGERVNTTEQRAALHIALRNRSDRCVVLDGQDVMPQVLATLTRMKQFSDEIRSGRYQPSGKPILNVVNIGIGGSDLGPRMVAGALAPYCDGPKAHFVSNLDGADLSDVVCGLDPATTLFVVASKSFTTQETMINARAALAWAGKDMTGHFVAVSTNTQATSEFGIPQERTFGFWDWVGGRFSTWSAIGLSAMIALGEERFDALLKGAHVADEHFRTSALPENIPVLMGLISIWHRNVCGYAAQAILPYDNHLVDFPRWLQQLEMESNGKSVSANGKRLDYATAPIIFGEPGTNGQHAFYQMLHQGTEMVPADFLVAAMAADPALDAQHRSLVANCFAQSGALMLGKQGNDADDNPHRAFAGNRPSNTFLFKQLDAETLGMLMALYEHRIFVEAMLWDINPFDQWGVELGKQMAGKLEHSIENQSGDEEFDPGTQGLMSVFHRMRGSD